MARVMLKRVGIVSVAKWQAFLTAILGLLVGAVYGAYYCLYYRTASAFVILWYLIGTPVMYAACSFLATVIGGVVYNSLAGAIGGMVLEFDNPPRAYDVPPTPAENFIKRPEAM